MSNKSVPECKTCERRKKYRIKENITTLKKYSVLRPKRSYTQIYPSKILKL